MKDAEFIELLNLYLDHEISAADAERLEAEVQRNPARRQIYRQYCQMQKACSMLSDDFAAVPDTAKVVAFEPQPQRASWQPLLWGATGFAAAACAAFLLLNRNHGPEIAPVNAPSVAASTYVVPVVEPQTPPPASDTRAIAQTVTMPSRRPELQPVLTANAFAVGSANQEQVTLAPLELAWIPNVKLAPMQLAPAPEQLRFEKQQILKTGSTILRSPHPIQGNVQMTAFQFQK